MIIVERRSRRKFYKQLFKWAGISVLALGLLAGALWCGHFLWKKWERRQSRELAKAAVGYLGQGRLREAGMALETASRLDPSNARALRLLAGLQLAGREDAEALGTMEGLAKTGTMGPGDLLEYFALALRQGDFALARRLADAASTGGSPALRHRLLAKVAIQAGNPAEAERELREAVAVDKTGRSPLELAQFFLSRQQGPGTHVEVLEVLRGVSILPGPNGAEAIALGLASGKVPMVEADGWIAALRAHPAATAPQLFTADVAEAALHPKRKSETVRRAARRLASRPLPERAAALDWMLANGEPETAASLLTPAEALQNPLLFVAWVDAHSRMASWRKSAGSLKRATAAPGWLAGLFESRALLAEGDSKKSREAADRALAEARANPIDFQRAVAFLAATGSEAEFEKPFQEALAKNPDKHLEVLGSVLPAVYARRNAAPALRAFELASAGGKTPLPPILQNDRDHLALLLGQPVDIESLAARSQAAPSHFPFRATHALALLREGRAHDAMQVLQDCKPDVQVALLPPRQKIIVASVFAAIGERDMARNIAASIPPGETWPEETAVFSEILAKPPAKPVAKAPPAPAPAEEAPPVADPAKEATRQAIEKALQGLETTADTPPDPTKKAINQALESAGKNEAGAPDPTRRVIEEALREQAAATENKTQTTGP
jgi:hypothetical protein